MKNKNMKDNSIIVSIVLATIVIVGTLIYVGSHNGGTKSFEEQLAAYQEKQDAKKRETQQKIAQRAQELAKNVPEISKEDHVYGNKNAGITIYEYSDFECPFCERYYKTPKTIVDESDGNINLVFRHFPLAFHGQAAIDEAMAAECAGEQGKFWEMHDAIFDKTNKNGRGIDGGVEAAAKSIGLDMEQFRLCMQEKKFQSKLDSDMQSGSDSGVKGTPGSIIKNNVTGEVVLIPGAYPIEAVREKIKTIQ